MIPFAVAMSGFRLPLICAAVIAMAALAGVVLDRAAAAGANAREVEHLAAVIEHNAAARAASGAAMQAAMQAERLARAESETARRRYETYRDALEARPIEGAGTRCPLDCVIQW